MAKQPCAIGREDFKTKAAPLTIDIGGTKLEAAPREFATGSFGWYLNGKVNVMDFGPD